MNEKPLLIFDFDGTLADSISIGLAVANELSSMFGYEKVDDLNKVRELSAVSFIFSQVSWYKLPVWAFLMKHKIKKHQDSIPLYGGIAELLTDLKKEYRIGLIGGGRPSYHTAILERHNVNFFDKRVGNQGTKKHKVIQKWIELGEDPKKLTYIGDDTRDIRAAKIAGISSVGVTWGTSARAVLEAENPSHLADSVSELRALFL